MRRCEPVITTNERKKGIEVPDVVHTAIRFLVIEMECWYLNPCPPPCGDGCGAVGDFV